MVLSLCAPFALKRAIAASANPGTTSSPATTPADKKRGPRRDAELLVRFREGVTEEQKDVLVAEKGARRAKKLKGNSRVEKLELQRGQDLDTLAAELRLNPAVELVEPNFLISRDQVTPGDPRFAEQWALKNTGATGGQPGADIQAAPAWETITGAPTTVIAVIDSGIDFTHPDLHNNQWTNGSERDNRRDDDHNGLTDDLHGWDWIANDNVIRDEQGHGTAVAGIIAAEGNNSIGTTGVMWRASLMSLRVLDNTGTGDVAAAIEAIDYAAGHGAQVINCSWGTDEESLTLKDAIQRAGTSGVVVVSSAGNSGRDIESEPYYPASFGLSNQIAVASTDSFDHLPQWSNFGASHVTVAAPGTDILTTRLGGDYTTVTGTSASTPLVTGVVGLIKTQRWWLSAAGTRAAIVDGARRVPELNGKVSSGGVVSAGGALQSLQGPDTAPPGSGNGNNGNGNNGNNAGGNGNGNNGNNPAVRPPTPGHGSGGTGPGGSFSTTPPPVTKTLPGSGNYNLDEMRRTKPSEPKAKAPIHADLLPLCDVDCGGTEPRSAGGSDPYFGTARTQPPNETGQPGVDLGSKNFNWSLPILGLPGRAGLDLSLSLSYNSLVWTRQFAGLNSSVMFNADHGFPGPGFQLGFPVLEAPYYDSDEGSYSYLLITPEGGRIQLKQTSNANVYESIDSSYTQLLDNRPTSGSLVVRTSDGTQLTFGYTSPDGDYRCTEIKDRNGNFITVAYNSLGRINTITDTLARVVTFNYDANNYLSSITQTWNGATHTWATFSFGELYMNPSFASRTTVLGPQNTTIPVLTQVSLDDGSYYTFNYTTFGQVNKITHYAPNATQLSYASYNLSTNSGQFDCPRFTEQHDWATHWNNDQEAVTTYSVASDNSWSQVTMPDGTVYRELFAVTSDWQNGLTIGTKYYASVADANADTPQKWTTTAYTQDDTSLTYQKNPRPYDMSIYDQAGNRRRTDIIYQAQYGLPYIKREYAADGTSLVRMTWIDYNLSQAYLDKHILGLVSAVHVTDGNYSYVSKTTYDYDWGGEYLAGTPQAATQHDEADYGAGFVSGRGNLSSVSRWDVTDINNSSKAIRQNTAYNSDGSVIFTRDALGHQNSISYTDSFSDSVNRNTFAYPTTGTDADGYSSTSKYNYDFGAPTRRQDPKAAAVSMEYDAAGRPTRVNNLVNTAYKKWTYPDSQDYITIDETINALNQEYHSFTLNDGAGRTTGAGGDLPNSTGGNFVQYTVYDVMGRAAQVSNPTEITANMVPAGNDLAGFYWTTQAYDWKGRPTLTTNPTDGTTRELTYGGCGCAGGEVVTERDERGRRRRMTMDVLGRLKQVDELNWDQSVYATTTYTYNTRDQLTNMNQSGQTRGFEYDGYGRLWKRTTPEQGQTTYAYNTDDTVQTVTDARGATATFGYNYRHLPTSITYGVPSGVAATPNVTFGYDEVGNRTSMADGLGSVTYHYDQLSRMDWEERAFSGLGTYRLSYGYNLAGELTNVTNPFSVQVNYTYDQMGRPTAVSGIGYFGVSSYINNIVYRAFGGTKEIGYGNGKTLSIGYDSRLRMTSWDVANVMGWSYAYDTPSIHENTNRVAFANNLYDHTLDRSYDYDNVGRLIASHTGVEGRGHAGYAPWGSPDGPYAQNYSYDQLGNGTWRNGWGAVNSQYSYAPQFVNNKMTVNPVTGAAVQYDASGNLVNDGQQTFTYDATGQQAYASSTGLTQNYDGNGLRTKKTDGGATIYYLRSSVLGGQVIAEITSSGLWQRGYVYLGGQMLAVQDSGVYWVHQDPVTKSQRLTNSAGNIASWVDMDPWGGETGRSSNQALQPHRFTSYERDGNGSDDAMMRRYEGKWRMFAQPDQFGGSYNLSDPQSFNRYAYTQNDPVNYVDPIGLFRLGKPVSFRNAMIDFADFVLESWSRFLDSINPQRPEEIEKSHAGSPQQQRQFDPNSQFCKSLLQKIINIGRDIVKRQDEFIHDPQQLDMIGSIGAKLKDDGFGHLKIIMDAYDNYTKRIQDYMDKCGGPPPGVPITRRPNGSRSSFSPGFNREAAAKAVGTVGAGVIIYFIIRTTLRFVVPVTNLVPVP